MKQVVGTDCNHRSIGTVAIDLIIGVDGVPIEITHKSCAYFHTGKVGMGINTGEIMFELATNDDARIWVNDGVTRLEED